MTRLSLALALIVGVGAGVSATGCASAEDGSEDPIGDGPAEQALLEGRKVEISEIVTLLKDNGIPKAVIPKLVCTAKYESSFFEGATNANNNGSIDRGLFQVNSIHLGSFSDCPAKNAAKELFSAEANVKCAAAIYRAQGLNAWYGYRAHKKTCEAFVLP
jgi:C-type lysozyme/alpha-lactalbumin family